VRNGLFSETGKKVVVDTIFAIGSREYLIKSSQEVHL
jgi:hypothetical protein